MLLCYSENMNFTENEYRACTSGMNNLLCQWVTVPGRGVTGFVTDISRDGKITIETRDSEGIDEHVFTDVHPHQLEVDMP